MGQAAAKRVLVAEDDPDLTRALMRYLAKRGFDPVYARQAEKILCLTDRGQVDAVVLDLGLGSQNGWEILRRLRERSPVPVVLITGSSVTEDTVKDAAVLGAETILPKPFAYEELIGVLRSF